MRNMPRDCSVMEKIRWQGSNLHIDEVCIDVGATIECALCLHSLVIVAMDSDSPEYSHRRFPNIRGYDARGSQVWEVELPSDHPEDAYWSLRMGDPLMASSFSSFRCRIDPATGRILEKLFYK